MRVPHPNEGSKGTNCQRRFIVVYKTDVNGKVTAVTGVMGFAGNEERFRNIHGKSSGKVHEHPATLRRHRTSKFTQKDTYSETLADRTISVRVTTRENYECEMSND